MVLENQDNPEKSFVALTEFFNSFFAEADQTEGLSYLLLNFLSDSQTIPKSELPPFLTDTSQIIILHDLLAGTTINLEERILSNKRSVAGSKGRLAQLEEQPSQDAEKLELIQNRIFEMKLSRNNLERDCLIYHECQRLLTNRYNQE